MREKEQHRSISSVFGSEQHRSISSVFGWEQHRSISSVFEFSSIISEYGCSIYICIIYIGVQQNKKSTLKKWPEDEFCNKVAAHMKLQEEVKFQDQEKHTHRTRGVCGRWYDL
eukprot:GHVS01029812.1.p2 GENE.GHVS01029812.1~~GHVS01029812.1.p2  ORF type:complete len:113 (+),score=14.10 GHVS01029812.1:417-755(+)